MIKQRNKQCIINQVYVKKLNKVSKSKTYETQLPKGVPAP
jgi:hypothetical protein